MVKFMEDWKKKLDDWKLLWENKKNEIIKLEKTKIIEEEEIDYQGEYKDGKRSGFGIFFYPNGATYEG